MNSSKKCKENDDPVVELVSDQVRDHRFQGTNQKLPPKLRAQNSLHEFNHYEPVMGHVVANGFSPVKRHKELGGSIHSEIKANRLSMCNLKTISPNTLLNKQSFTSSHKLVKTSTLGSQITLKPKMTPIINKTVYASPVKQDCKMRKANSEKRVKHFSCHESTTSASSAVPSDQLAKPPTANVIMSTRNNKLPLIYQTSPSLNETPGPKS